MRKRKHFTTDKVVNKRINDFLDKFYMRDKGRFFFKERWVSICSTHQEYNKECKTCNIGSWKNVWINNIEGLLFKIYPKLYRWIMKFKKIQLINIIEQNEKPKYFRRNKK